MAATDVLTSDTPSTLRRYKKEMCVFLSLHELHKHRISPFVLVLVRDCFQRYDKSRCGELPAHLFEDCLQAAGNRLPSKAVNLLVAYCIDSNHTASFPRLQSLISAYGDGSRTSPQLSDLRIQFVQRLEERFGSGVKAFAYFDEDKDGEVYLGDFYQAAVSLGLGRRQEDIKALFDSLTPGSSQFLTFSQFMTLFSNPETAISQPSTRIPPQQSGVYILHSKAPPPRVCFMQWDHFMEEDSKPVLQRKWQLPSDNDPTHIYGRANRGKDKIEDLLSHSFVIRKSSSPHKSPPIPTRSPKPTTLPKLPPFR